MIKKNISANKSHILFLLILIVVVLVVFWPMQWVFYQQDEWHSLGFYLSQNNIAGVLQNYNLIKIITADGRFLSAIAGYLLIGLFPFNTFPVFIYSLGFHIVNTLLVFKLARRFLESDMLSFLAAVFFGVSSISVGAVTWYGTSVGTLPSTTLTIVSVIFFLKALDGDAKKNLLFSFLTLYLSLFFKETGFFFLLFFPGLFLLLKRVGVKKFISFFWYYFLSFAVIAFLRYIQLNSYTNESVVFTPSSTGNFLPLLLLRAVLYPLTSFFLVYIPPEFFLKIAKYFTNLYYPFLPSEHVSLIIQSVVGDLLAIAGALVLLFALLLLSWQRAKRSVIFLVSFALITYLPYIILSKDYTYLDSRYYYLGTVPAGIILLLILQNIKKTLGVKFYLPSLLIMIVYLFALSSVTITETSKLADVSRERLSLLKQITQLKPVLGEKNIFYITGNRDYYLSKGNSVPFQQGTGYTLLTWYGKSDDRFNNLLEKAVLWDLGSQGYYEENNLGFGFFWDKSELIKTVSEKSLDKTDVNYFYYDSDLKKLSNLNL